MTPSATLQHLLNFSALTLALAFTATVVRAQDDPGRNKFPLPQPVESVEETAAADEEPQGGGSLAIQAIQGTEGAAAIGSLPVEIDLISQHQVIQTIKTQLDEFGVVVVHDLPIEPAIRPLVRIKFSDVSYEQIGALMDSTNPQQRIRVICYETTEVKPDWTVRLRQVMVVEAGHGIKVTEIIIAANPTPTTWIGSGTGLPSSNTRETISIALPAGAENVTLGNGSLAESATVRSGELISHMPLMPGENEFNFSYTMHSNPQGKINLLIPQASPVSALVLIVEEAIPVDELQVLTLGGEHQIGVTPVRYYEAAGLLPGQVVGLQLAGFNHAEEAPAPAESLLPGTAAETNGNATSFNAQLIAGIGIAVLFLGGIAFILLMKSKSVTSLEKD